jgi:sporulation protein YlmC with PRC-barrel domain
MTKPNNQQQRNDEMRNSANTSTGSSLIDSNRVEGTEVFDPNGKHIGNVKRLIIEKVSGRVVYAVANFGGFLGVGGDEYTIPWNALDYDTGLGGFRTDITEEQLKNSPDFGRNNFDDWDDRANETTLYDYYGEPYYWSV